MCLFRWLVQVQGGTGGQAFLDGPAKLCVLMQKEIDIST